MRWNIHNVYQLPSFLRFGPDGLHELRIVGRGNDHECFSQVAWLVGFMAQRNPFMLGLRQQFIAELRAYHSHISATRRESGGLFCRHTVATNDDGYTTTNIEHYRIVIRHTVFSYRRGQIYRAPGDGADGCLPQRVAPPPGGAINLAPTSGLSPRSAWVL